MLNSPADWIAHLRACAPADGLPPLEGLPPAVLQGPGIDGLLWRATAAPALADAADAALALRPGASLVDQGRFRTLEVWTECELAALHALWRLCRVAPTPARLGRLDELRSWHLEHTQPDNATNRPWAVHAFVAAPGPENQLYAETLLLNFEASSARTEPLSRWILRDAARELELAAP